MNFTYIEIKNSLKELGIRELENLQYDIINEQNKRMEKLKEMELMATGMITVML